MLWYYARQICCGLVLVTGFYTLCAAYAYRVNALRAKDDPELRGYEFGAVFLVPFTWLLLLPLSIMVAILRALLGMMFIVLFAIGVIAIRRPFILTWLDKLATKIGNKLLAVNTALLRAFLGKPMKASK